MRLRNAFLSALSLSLLLGAGPAFAAVQPPAVNELEDRGEIDKIQCDSMAEADLHVGDSLNFYISFTAEKDTKVKVSSVSYWFWADKDYNAGDPSIAFAATKEFKNGDGIIQNRTIQLMRSTDYVIREKPSAASKENIIVKYDVAFNPFLPDGTLSPEEGHFVGCARYRVLPQTKK